MVNINIDLSIIIPVYNTELYLTQCLQSIFETQLTNFEVIVVNDQSPGDCSSIVKRFQEKFSNLIYFEKPNGGVSSARNFGLQRSRGEYVYFVDSDDFIIAKNLKPIVEMIKKNNLDFLCASGFDVDDKGNLISSFKIPKNLPKSEIMTGQEFVDFFIQQKCLYITIWIYLYKKSFLEKNEIYFIEGIKQEDMVFTPLTWLLASRCSYTNTPLYNYRHHALSTTQTNYRSLVEGLYKGFLILLNKCQNMNNCNKKIKNHILGNHLHELYVKLAECDKDFIVNMKEDLIKIKTQEFISYRFFRKILKKKIQIYLRHGVWI